MDIVTLSLCQTIAKSAVSGIKSFRIDGLNLIMTTNDGKILTMTFPKPDDGISVTNIEIDNNNHLICTLSDNSTIDAGEIKGGSGGGGGSATLKWGSF